MVVTADSCIVIAISSASQKFRLPQLRRLHLGQLWIPSLAPRTPGGLLENFRAGATWPGRGTRYEIPHNWACRSCDSVYMSLTALSIADISDSLITKAGSRKRLPGVPGRNHEETLMTRRARIALCAAVLCGGALASRPSAARRPMTTIWPPAANGRDRAQASNTNASTV